MDFNSIVNDFIQIMEIGLSNDNKSKAFIMNKTTAKAICIDPIPFEYSSDTLKVFGMNVFYNENMPDNVIGILEHTYAVGHTLLSLKDFKFRDKIRKIVTKGSFIYDNIQFYGLTDSSLPEWKPKIIESDK